MALKVIGAGFGRTGTASLKIALERLLGGPCYHMSEVLGNPGHVDLWLDAAAGKPDWEAIFGGYVASVDYPACSFWRQLADAYPDARILLSVRDAERWFQSTQETIFSTTLQSLYAGTRWGRMIKATIDDKLGARLNDHDALVAAFTAHNAAVSNAFDPDRLLVYEVSQGWAPLCKFLDCEQPEEEFPYVNSKDEFTAVFDLLRSPVGERVMNGEGIEEQKLHDDMFK